MADIECGGGDRPGVTIDSALAPFMRIPDHVSLDHACLAGPIVATHRLIQEPAQVKVGDDVVVVALQRIDVRDFSRARRVWADHEHFGVVAGQGDARELRRHIRELRAAYDVAEKPATRENLRQRIGKLMGG